MENYELIYRESVGKDLRRLPADDLRRILARLEALQENPRPPGAEKLSGQERYRIRAGDYRIVYEIVDQRLLVVVVKEGHSGDIYRRKA